MGFVLPFANFILDTTFTLFRRLIRREKWYQAHRSHVYQRMTDLGMTHGNVTSIELLVGIASCAAAAACIPAGSAVLIAPDELRSLYAKAPFPGAFALTALDGTVHAALGWKPFSQGDHADGHTNGFF